MDVICVNWFNYGRKVRMQEKKKKKERRKKKEVVTLKEHFFQVKKTALAITWQGDKCKGHTHTNELTARHIMNAFELHYLYLTVYYYYDTNDIHTQS